MNYFDNFIKKYDMTDEDIQYKYHHSYRVMDNIEILAKCMNLPYKDIELAKCIGLLHDIGRFEQDKLYNSFIDDKMDHGNYGENILRKEDILSQFNIEEEDYETVYKAIRNHNKYEIEPDLSQREILFSKLIRDADKLDILYALGTKELKPVLYEDETEILLEIKKTFYQEKSIKKTGKENKNDNLIIVLSFIYDINFKPSMEIIKKYKYYEKIYQRIKNKDIFKTYFEYIYNYIKERTD